MHAEDFHPPLSPNPTSNGDPTHPPDPLSAFYREKAKLALKIEGGSLDPSRAGGAVAEMAKTMAKTTLAAARRAVGFPNKPALAVVSTCALLVEDRFAHRWREGMQRRLLLTWTEKEGPGVGRGWC